MPAMSFLFTDEWVSILKCLFSASIIERKRFSWLVSGKAILSAFVFWTRLREETLKQGITLCVWLDCSFGSWKAGFMLIKKQWASEKDYILLHCGRKVTLGCMMHGWIAFSTALCISFSTAILIYWVECPTLRSSYGNIYYCAFWAYIFKVYLLNIQYCVAEFVEKENVLQLYYCNDFYYYYFLLLNGSIWHRLIRAAIMTGILILIKNYNSGK